MNQEADKYRELHYRHCDGDLTASSAIVVDLHERIAKTLYKKHQALGLLSFEDCQDIASDTLHAYLYNPQQYDPEKSPLVSYLLMAGHADCVDLARKIRRRQEILSSSVEDVGSDANSYVDTLLDQLSGFSLWMRYGPEIAKTVEEKRVLRLMMEGIRETSEYAHVMGLKHEDDVAVRRKVKSCKDRLEKRLVRLSERMKDEK